jgi:hypothetical protein
MQRTPSLSTIPPSVAAALALSDLRPKGIEPARLWEYGLTSRALYPLLSSPRRVWAATDDRSIVAMSKHNRGIEVVERFTAPVAAMPSQSGPVGYFPLGDGAVIAVDLLSGTRDALTTFWRANVGGLANRTPVATATAVYAAGDDTGVVRLDRETGEVVWRSDRSADRLIAAGNEFAYVRDRQGRLLVYDANRPTDPALRRSAPLAALDVAAFNIPVTNAHTERIFLAADNGLIVCLRGIPKPGAAIAAGAAPPPPPAKALEELRKVDDAVGGGRSVAAALKMLEEGTAPKADTVVIRNIITKLTEKNVIDRLGPPDETGILEDGRVLRYGWLLIGVDDKGVVMAMARVFRSRRPGDWGTVVTIE